MRTVLITTTIYVPTVLRRYREMEPDIFFIITGDEKTPHDAVEAFVRELGNASYFGVEEQKKLGYRSSEIIGWNKIMRRNIALLEAIKLKPDVIVTIDDDNLPLADDYFANFAAVLGRPFSGLMASSETGWFNVGDFLVPAVYHRGYSYERRILKNQFRMLPVQGKKVGVAAGLWLGDPDIDAMERITNAPLVMQVSEVIRHGVIVDPALYAPVNSQNTAFVAELAPLMMVLVGVGRYDDIWASYIAERVMRTLDYHVHYGRPLVWQERNPQNLWKNVRDELFGMEFTPKFCADLDAIELPAGSVLDKLEAIYEGLRTASYLPEIVLELGEAWCKDLRGIL